MGKSKIRFVFLAEIGFWILKSNKDHRILIFDCLQIRTASPGTGASALAVGLRVVLQGLSAEELNGKYGQVAARERARKGRAQLLARKADYWASTVFFSDR